MADDLLPCETDEEEWGEDDLPVSDAVPVTVEAETEEWTGDGSVPVTAERAARRRRARLLVPKGNTKVTDQAEARRQSILEAQARGDTTGEPDQWREDLHAGQRWRAADNLASKDHTHNSGSGFGLA